MRHILKKLFKRRFGNDRNKGTLGYQIPPTVWMSDLKKASDYGALLAEKARRLKARVLEPAGAATGSGS
jgi:hypothetical protein